MDSITLFESGMDFVMYFLNLRGNYFGFELSNLEILIGCSSIYFISYFIHRSFE